jgi:hypothetical protein
MRELAHVHLGSKMTADGGFQGLPWLETPARQRPGAEEGRLRPFPEENLENAVSDLEHGRKRLMGRAGLCGRLGHPVID